MQELGLIDIHCRVPKKNYRDKWDTIRKCHIYAYDIAEYRVLHM